MAEAYSHKPSHKLWLLELFYYQQLILQVRLAVSLPHMFRNKNIFAKVFLRQFSFRIVQLCRCFSKSNSGLSICRIYVSCFTIMRLITELLTRTGGTIVTKKMLDMFRRPTDPPEFNEYYLLPGVAAVGGSGLLFATGLAPASLAPMLALGSSLACVGGISCLSSQQTARY